MKGDKFQKRVQRYGWDKSATYYERSWGEQLKPALDELIKMANPQQGESAIDIASGSGLSTFPIADLVGDSGSVLGTDISEEMVKLTRSNAELKGVTNVRFSRMSADELECEDDSFDLSVCSLGLMYVPNSEAAIEQMYRVTRLGGRAAVSVWGARKNCGWAEIFPIVNEQVASEVCPLFFSLGTGDSLKFALERVGFKNIEVSRLSVALDFGSGEAACEAAFLGGPVALAYDRFDEDTRKQVKSEYLKSLKHYYDGNSFKVPGEFVIARAIK
jgi:ubiquinone/menaquinone biosynthesis C-methylase UbiE